MMITTEYDTATSIRNEMSGIGIQQERYRVSDQTDRHLSMRKIVGFIPHIAVFLFVCVVLGTALYTTYPFVVYALVTESSAGTWVSSMLLVAGATTALLIASQMQKRTLWVILAGMLFLLAADERFMIHEYLKKVILFTLFEGNWKRMGKADEIPVVLAAVSGGILSFRLFRIRQTVTARLLLGCAVILGITSVVIDVLCLSPVTEEICKLVAELMLILWLFEIHRSIRET